MNPGRRNVTKLLAAAAGSTLLPRLILLDQDALDQLSASIKKSSSIDMRAVNSLSVITENHWRLVYGGVPKRDLIFTVQGHLQSIIQFLHYSPLTLIEEQLYMIASQQAQIMCEIYFDMHEYQKAEIYAKFAIDAAQKANNPALYAVALARMSFLYTYNHQFKGAFSFLQVARRFAEQAPETTICCWITAIEAEVQSNIFAHYNETQAFDACLKALEHAELISEQTEDDVFCTKFSPASLAGYKGVCYKQLRKPAQAQSVNALQRVRDFRAGLEQWKSTSHVRDLDEQIAMTHIHIM